MTPLWWLTRDGDKTCLIINEDNDDAKALSDAVTFACDGCSGAMHQAACTHVMWIKAHGWDKYVEMMSKHEAAKGDGSKSRGPGPHMD